MWYARSTWIYRCCVTFVIAGGDHGQKQRKGLSPDNPYRLILLQGFHGICKFCLSLCLFLVALPF